MVPTRTQWISMNDEQKKIYNQCKHLKKKSYCSTNMWKKNTQVTVIHILRVIKKYLYVVWQYICSQNQATTTELCDHRKQVLFMLL